mgnify:CR=1 FL=1
MNIRNYLKGIGVGIIVASLVLIIAGKFNNKAMSDDDVIKRAKELGMVESTTLTQPSANNGLANTSDTQVVSDDKNSGADDSLNNSADDKNSDGTEASNSDADSSTGDKTANTSDNDSKSNTDSKTVDDKTVNTSDSDSKDNSDSKTADDKSVNASDTDSKSNSDSKTTDDKSADSSSNADKTSNATDKTVKSTDTVSVEVKSGMSSESAAAAVKDAGLVDDDIEFNKYLCANGYDKRLRVGQYDIPKGSDFETIAKYLCGE